MLNKKILLVLAVFWTSLVTYLSLATVDTSIGSSIHINNKDKIVHFVFYFLLSVLWIFYLSRNQLHYKISLIIMLAAIVYGLIMEVFQGVFTATRTTDLFDVFANSFGAISGWLLTRIYLQNKRL